MQKLKQKESLIKWFEWFFIAALVGLVVLNVFLDLLLPSYMADIFRAVENQQSTGHIWNIGLKMLGITFGSVACAIVVGYLSSMIAANIGKRLRRNLFVKVNSFSQEEINKFSTASLITRSTNDVNQVQQTTMMFLRLAIMAPVMAVGALLKVLGQSPTLSMVVAAAIGAILIIVLFMIIVVVPKFTVQQKYLDRLNLVARENLTGLRVIRASNAEKREEARFEKASRSFGKVNLFVTRSMSLLMPTMQMIMSGLSLAIAWISAHLISRGELQFADITQFTQYSMQIVMSFMLLIMVFVMLPRAIVSGRRIREVLKTESKITDGHLALPQSFQESKDIPAIEFKNVGFTYPGAEKAVLKNINLTIMHGEKVAFIGGTGSGKSTLINLIPRFFDCTEGELLIDGANVKDYKLSELRNKLGYVPQAGVLFSGTIENNVKYGKVAATEEEVNEAIKMSQAEEFVLALPDGKQHRIAQGGKNVSGGQKQRLSIARALIRNAEILIFDDSFSALDFSTDRKLRDTLSKNFKTKTSLVVAQRIGTIMDSDKIVVLNDGEIAGIGRHAELLQSNEVYRQIAESQLSKEELKQ